MTRWSLLTIAFAVVACSEGDRDRVARDASDAAADADSALETDPSAVEPGAPREAETEDAPAAGPAATRPAADAGGTGERATADTAGTRGPTGAEAMGGIRAPRAGAATGGTPTPTATGPLNLSTDEVRRLQAALNEAGCDAGAVDGVVGRQTRQAIACGLEKNDLRSNDMSGLYRALDLDFD